MNQMSLFPDDAKSFRSERQLAYQLGSSIATDVPRVGKPLIPNPQSQDRVGLYRADTSRRSVLADLDYINRFVGAGEAIPGFLEAGPKEYHFFDARSVRAAIVTSGGIAPGLNRVVHSIVQRHCSTYECHESTGGVVYGVIDGVYGLVGEELDLEVLTPEKTASWLTKGGSALGSVRYKGKKLTEVADNIARNLRNAGINIIYVIGGDGSLNMADALAKVVPEIAVVGVPKTMDNDIMWVAQSFGFSTAVAEAAKTISFFHTESESTRRVGIIELFGAHSGFVAANAAHACGCANLVLIPEMFATCQNSEQLMAALQKSLQHVRDKVSQMKRGSGLIVVAEGVGMLFEKYQVLVNGVLPEKGRFAYAIEALLKNTMKDQRGREIQPFVNRPRHHIRSAPPNAFDQTYCDRLGALAVETGLAGYTRCVVSFWLSEYVLVPLSLLANQKKLMTTEGMFWKQVLLSTGQPNVS
jgi:6-phosphofructokinase 1